MRAPIIISISRGRGEDRVTIVDPAGQAIGYNNLPNLPANLCFGGNGGKTLFITAADARFCIRRSVRGQ
jgi:sugar lactone lactonase YvrE